MIFRLPFQKQAGLRRQVHTRRGFALVASLTLMMLLGLIAVGILAVASSQNRVAAQSILQDEARQQALMGLHAAISDLQMELGPDQRVSASSGILSASNDMPQHILGVWDSWKAPLYGSSEGKKIQSTYTTGRASMFRRWLISSANPDSLRDMSGVKDIASRRPGSRICLVGEGTLGPRVDKQQYVYADMVTTPSSGRNETCFAWWVGGENQKANIAIAPREKTSDPGEILRRTWDTPPPSFKESNVLSFLPDEIENPEKLLTLGTLPMAERGATEVGKPYFFDVTTYSYSLLTNARDGGLKLDLNLLLNKEKLAGTGLEARADQDCPLAEGEDLPVGTEQIFPIGSWQTLHAYYNTWPDGSGKEEDFSGKRLTGNVNNAVTRMNGDMVSDSKSTISGKNYAVTYYDEHAREDSDSAGYARVPVLLSFIAKYGIVVSEPPYNQGVWEYYKKDQWKDQGYHSIGAAYAPMALWWNPYNVPMRVSAKKLWFCSLPYRTTALMFRYSAATQWQRSMMFQPFETEKYIDGIGVVGQRNTFGNDWGNYCVFSEQDQSTDIYFEPGEILMFSMSNGFDNLNVERRYTESGVMTGKLENKWTFSLPQDVPMVQGDQAGYLHNYFIALGQHIKPETYSGKYMMEIALETQDGYNSVTRNNQDYNAYYGTLSGKKYLHDTVGEDLGPSERELFVVPHGFNGVDTSRDEYVVKQSTTLPQARPTATLDAYPGAEGISPYNFSLGWYDYSTTPIDQVTFMGGNGNQEAIFNSQMYTEGEKEPQYFAAMGVAPKSFNPGLQQALPMFRGKDYRTRNWMHSNPAMGGGHLYRPDDQLRQYHPFQLAAYPLDSRVGMETVNAKNGMYGITSLGLGGGETVSFISALELPVHPPFSIAGFSGMRLKPGWYRERDSGKEASIARMRRMQYQAGVPGVGIGNSFADPCLPPDDVYTYHETNINTDLSTNGQLFSDFYDHGFIINDALWDRWFCSSVSDMPENNGGSRKAQNTLQEFVEGEQPLPVSRYKLAHSAASKSEIINRIMKDDGWKQIARYLMIEGGFNVNSVSEEAWTATLLGLARRDVVSNTMGRLHAVNRGDTSSVLFSRFMVASGDRTVDNGGGYSPLLGAAFLRPSMRMATAWGDVRELDSGTIRELARRIVEKVRERGPFLNMADFINRRLDGGSDAALTGALQAAIDATDINRIFTDPEFNVTPQSGGSLYKYPKAEEGSMFTAAPGYLIQSDVLTVLGNILTVRDDTFTVRAYGCVRSKAKAILSQAWCEATVQRTIDYVDPTDTPDKGSYSPGAGSAAADAANRLNDVNRVMGRKMRIVSFRWLDAWDI